MEPLSFTPHRLRFKALIGVGGIGSGRFFALQGNHTLGREESRAGRFLERRDFCKLHIICHYVSRLLGPNFATIPVGRVGSDSIGKELLAEMNAAGIDLRFVEEVAGKPTLFSFCFVYPDGSGGNLTTDDSACSRVDAAYVRSAEPEIQRWGASGIVLAVPEVPLEARIEILRLGTAHGSFRVGSFTPGELREVLDSNLLQKIDLMAMNRDEAAMAAGLPSRKTPPEQIARRVGPLLRKQNRQLFISITAGQAGSWVDSSGDITHLPAPSVPVISTAGAGDAHLAGLIAGLSAGLEPREAHQLAVLVASLSVTSPHTIHEGLDRRSLQAFAVTHGLRLNAGLAGLLDRPSRSAPQT